MEGNTVTYCDCSSREVDEAGVQVHYIDCSAFSAAPIDPRARLLANASDLATGDRAEARYTHPDTGGQKGTKAARFSLLPWSALAEVAEHYNAGAAKYDDHNWRRGYPPSLSFDALGRHLAAWWEGEDADPETGTSHLAACAFHVLTMMVGQAEHPELDDRPHVTLGKGATCQR